MTLTKSLNQLAKQSLQSKESGPYLICNWINFVLIHYEVDRRILQLEIPYSLDLYCGKAYVSLVAFTLEEFRFVKANLLTQWLVRPFATHHYFNVRTYVQHREGSGIYFIKEWISNSLCAFIGSQLYGLPCHHGRLNYQHNDKEGRFTGQIFARNNSGRYQYSMKFNQQKALESVRPGSLDEFLLERYVAFVKGMTRGQFFRIWHQPWEQVEIEINYLQDNLVNKIGPWGKTLECVKAHFSPGVYGVWMGRPQWLDKI